MPKPPNRFIIVDDGNYSSVPGIYRPTAATTALRDRPVSCADSTERT